MKLKQISTKTCCTVFGLMALCTMAQSKKAVDYVNPLIGTPEAGFKDGLDGGGTMPCVGTPFAMTNFVVQTSENKISRMPYVYEDTSVLGFMATHQPTVWMGDYGNVSVMPQIGELRLLPKGKGPTLFPQKRNFQTPLLFGDHGCRKKENKGGNCGGIALWSFQVYLPRSGTGPFDHSGHKHYGE